MDLKVKNGADPDNIPGIERLWLWRCDMMAEEFGKAELEFFAAVGVEDPQGRHERGVARLGDQCPGASTSKSPGYRCCSGRVSGTIVKLAVDPGMGVSELRGRTLRSRRSS